MDGKVSLITAVLLIFVFIFVSCIARESSEPDKGLDTTNGDHLIDNSHINGDGVTILASGTIAPEPTPKVAAISLPDMGQAPEILNEVWINTDEPITLASQRGKVVLLEFWTFG